MSARERAAEGTDEPGASPDPSQLARALLVVVAIFVGAVWLTAALAPDEVREKPSPGSLDNVFASPIVIAAARVVLLSAAVTVQFAALYIVVSILVRMGRRQWLHRAGPFESELADQLKEGLSQGDAMVQRWVEANEQSERLEAEIEKRDRVIQGLLAERHAPAQDSERGG